VQLVAGFGRHEVAGTVDGERQAAVGLVDAGLSGHQALRNGGFGKSEASETTTR
jgi:hypothetical protein